MEDMVREADESILRTEGKSCLTCCSDQEYIEPLWNGVLSTEANPINYVNRRPKSKTAQFYFVKVRPSPEECDLLAKIEKAESWIQKKQQAQSQIQKKLQKKMSEEDGISLELRRSQAKMNHLTDVIQWRKADIENMQRILDELLISSKKPRPRTAIYSRPRKKEDDDEDVYMGNRHYTEVTELSLLWCRNRFQDRMGKRRMDVKYLEQTREIYSSENPRATLMTMSCIHTPREELDEIIKGLHYRIRHGNNNLAAERKLMREIKLAETTRDKHTYKNRPICYWHEDKVTGSKQAAENEIKVMSKEVDGLRISLMQQKSEVMHLLSEQEAAENIISSLKKQLEVQEEIFELRKQLDELNSSFGQYRCLLSKARELARMKDVAGVKELSYNQVEEYMRQWNNSKVFRKD